MKQFDFCFVLSKVVCVCGGGGKVLSQKIH